MKPHLIQFALLAVGFAVSVAAAPVEIKLATILPEGTSGHQRLMEMRSAWQKAAPQEVKLTVRGGSADGEQILVKLMVAGRIHAALISAVGLAQIDRSVTALQIMPLMFRDWNEVDYVREKIRDNLEQRMREKGFQVLFWADAGWVRFFSKEPAMRPADFKPMKMFVWTGDPHQLSMLRNLGYQPVGLETEQILPSLSTGMINVVPVPPFLANALQYNRHTGHMVDLNWVPIVGAAVVRRQEWDKLPATTRRELLKIAEGIGVTIRAKNREEDEAAIAAMKKRGLVVHTPTPEAEAEWRKLAEQVHPQIRGTMVPADLFDQVQAHLTEYRATRRSASR